MKKNIHKKVFEMLRSKGILAISSALLLVSCGVYTGGYSETDGVYYDPNRDTLPEGVAMNGGNQVGQYYDYQNNDYPLEQSDVVYDRYKGWNGISNSNLQYPSSDWGDYTGTETNYYDNGWYGGYGYWGSPWGWNSFGPSWGWNVGFGWGSPYGWYGGYSPYWNYGWGWGNPYYSWYGLGYNPYYWGGGYYANHWGYNSYNAPKLINRRSSANGRFGTVNGRSYGNSGFRNNTTTRSGGSNSGFRNQNGYGNTRNTTVPRNTTRTRDYTPQRSQPNYSTPRNDGGGFRSSGGNVGGFRSGGMSTGGARSGGGGGFRR